MKEFRVKEAYQKEYGGEYRVFAAPGRINLIGEHTDYNDGFVLPAAIDKRIYLAIRPRNDNTAFITSVDFNEKLKFQLDSPAGDLPHWAKYPYGVVKELLADGHKIKGFDAAFGGDIPTGAGLSSSAAIECAFALALNTIYELGIDRLSLAKIGQRAEHNYAGVKCGIMDQFASLHGQEGHVIKLDCRSLGHELFPLELDGYELILTDTRVKHSLASTEYNTRRYQCEEGLMLLQRQMPAVKSLRDVRSKNVYPYKGLLGEEVFLRCEYVTEENERVEETCKALAIGDLDAVGQLMYQSHEGLRTKYHVSCEELDLLVSTARKVEGVMGSRMMGGGFGGCTLTLLKTSAVKDFKEKTRAAFAEKFGEDPVFYQVNISQGACEL